MDKLDFDAFVLSNDTLRVYAGDSLVFHSKKNGLLALLEYITGFGNSFGQVSVLDKVAGNAAALLSIKAGCSFVQSPLASQLAVRTLEKYGIGYNITTVVPYIQKAGSLDMCPIERLSIEKQPEEFYLLLTDKFSLKTCDQTV